MRNSLQIQLDRLANDRWARRGVRTLLRASVLALSLVCIAVGLNLALGWPLSWSWTASLALGCIAIGAVLVLRPRMPTREVARRLDQRFKLNEQLTTALELGPQAEGVGLYLHEQSRRTIAQIRRQVASRQRFPWSELALVLALALLLAGLILLTGLGSALPPLVADALPPLATAPDPDERFPEEPFQQPAGAQPGPGPGTALAPSPADAAAAAAIADALRDQSVTRPAAEALDQGDLAGAAQSLRELADQASGLSDQARAELAQDLREAAGEIGQQNPGLAEQIAESAQGIAPTGESPAEAIESLADAIDQLGQGEAQGEGEGQQPGQGQAQGEGQQPGEAQSQGGGGAGQSSLPGQQREGSGERLGVDGVPLELESEGEGDLPTGGEPTGDETAPSGGTSPGGGFARGSQSGERVEVGDDPLRIPADLRDVVQDYFSP